LTKEEIETKILQLKNSLKKTTVLIEAIKILIPNCNVEETLKIHFISNELQQYTFEIFQELEEIAYKHAKNDLSIGEKK